VESKQKLDGLKAQQAELDKQFDELDAKIAKGETDSIDAAPQTNLLMAKQNRLDRQIRQAEAETSTVYQQVQTAQAAQAEAQWARLAQQHAAIAETPAAVAQTLKTLWSQSVAAARQKFPNASQDYQQARADVAFEAQVAALEAKAQQGKGAGQAAQAGQGGKGAAVAAGAGKGHPPKKGADGRVLPAGASPSRPPQRPVDPETEFVQRIQSGGGIRSILE
jgi:uncharacterized protein YdcH (DUF465 family)